MGFKDTLMNLVLFPLQVAICLLHFLIQTVSLCSKGNISASFSSCVRALFRVDAKDLLTPDFVNKMLHEEVKMGKVVKQVRVQLVESCGDGKASTTDRTHFEVEFGVVNKDGGTIDKDIHCLVLKAVLLPWYMRLGSSIPLVELCAKMGERFPTFDNFIHYCINIYNYYLPQAPDAMYINETLVYSKILSTLNGDDIEKPKCYGTLFNPIKCQYFILMEDLTLHKVQFPTALDTLSIQHIKQLLDSLAHLHSKFWHSKRFSKDLSWVVTSERGGMYRVFRSIGKGLIRDHVRKNKFEQDILKPLGLSVEEMWECLLVCEKMFCSAENGQTLCHGDTHIQNTYVINRNGNVKVGLLDWQLTLKSHWSRDVAYILGTALTPGQRRRYEMPLLKYYLKALEKNGIDWQGESIGKSEDFDFNFKYRYSVSMCWGLVIGWLICPANNYGEKILAANLKRLVAACVELKTFDIIRNEHIL